jgi:hypothetical protein
MPMTEYISFDDMSNILAIIAVYFVGFVTGGMCVKMGIIP